MQKHLNLGGFRTYYPLEGQKAVRETEKSRVQDLLQRLERLESVRPAPEEAAIKEVAQQAIVDEIKQIVRRDWLAVYRNGSTLDAVCMA